MSKNENRGCMFYALLYGGILFSLVAILFMYIAYTANKWAKEYTAEKKVELPKVDAKQEEVKGISQKLQDFHDRVMADKPVKDLSLSAKELNTLIQHSPDFSDLRGLLHLKIEGDQIKGKFSVPLGDIPTLQGRYFNGEAGLRIRVNKGVWDVTLVTPKAKGKDLPERLTKLLNQYAKDELVKDLQKNPNTKKFIKKIQNILVKDGKIVLSTKLPSGQAIKVKFRTKPKAP